MACATLQGTWSGLGEGLSNGLVYALLLAPRHIWTKNRALHFNVTKPQASEVLFAGGDFRLAGYDSGAPD